MIELNKKGISGEGLQFNLKRLSILIIFVLAIIIAIIILIPRLTAESAGGTTFNFGKYVWDIITGGAE